MTHTGAAYRLNINPIVLKELMADCGITQADLAAATGLARPTINLVANRGYIPATGEREFKRTVEEYLAAHHGAANWLDARSLAPSDIWQPAGKALKNRQPAGRVRGPSGRHKPGCIPGDPERLIINWEVEMVEQETLKHFKIFRNPFIDDIQKDGDIFMSEDHRYIEAAMLDAAHHGGFLAVIGEVGSGKSVMRRKVVEQLRRDGDVLVIFPQIIDKTRLNAASICDAIIMDISDQRPRIKLEQKTRQVSQLLLERSKQGYRSVLVIEEAHDLYISTLKYLKRFYELEDGYRKLLGIILIGQVELKGQFNEATNVGMREVIRRIQIAEIKGLNGSIKEYLSLKFRRVGSKVEDIFTDGAIEALGVRLTSLDRQNKKISHAYPLVVNNYAAKAMNSACEMGEQVVTDDVVRAL